jgi:hypothetical protein
MGDRRKEEVRLCFLGHNKKSAMPMAVHTNPTTLFIADRKGWDYCSRVMV